MRTAPVVGAIALALLAAGVVMAASPPPSPSASAHASATPKPSATPRPSATPKPSATPRPTATPTPSASPSPSPSASHSTTGEAPLSAAVQQINIAGMATLTDGSNGTGTLAVKLTGLDPGAVLTVDVDGGTIALPREDARDEIAFRAGPDIDRTTDSIRIHLTALEMGRFMAARSRVGVVVFVSDGTRIAGAEFANAG